MPGVLAVVPQLTLLSPQSHQVVQAGLELVSVLWDYKHMLSHHVLFLEGMDRTRQ